ncbi:RhtB (resistance to homoserine/threonine) family protein [Mesocricetibacter intestinalis]|uniref:RhtB (Resistance to homoserine/threonine) family protein n=1 Tax=Mesocricetibacter intestinalis TaxID=1521930 RepID=A0A4R6VH49_9PAST|nr:homoserine/threonine efflux transporter [Mesocricetibacter intestinalis]TDQ57419.1 RhtB (resistance to homoserine/threonine) family protein [Mesocricetibacter intestinalis]
MFNLIILHFFGLVTPGPDFFYVSRMAASNSRRNAVCGIIGITLGVAFWAAAAMLGLALLFATTPLLHGIIMLLGGGYLAYLGLSVLRSRNTTTLEQLSEGDLNRTSSIRKEILKGLLVNLSNAKAIIYFASVMSLVLVNISGLWQILTAFLIIVTETFVYFYLISVFFSRPFAKRFYLRYNRYIDIAAGVIFLLFGLFLAYSGVIEIFNR